MSPDQNDGDHNLTMPQAILKQQERYNAAAHAVQSGVQAEIDHMGEAGAAASPKHLRTGVNIALVDSGALAGLLIRKGLITKLEYATALADTMEAEKKRYERRLSAQLGKGITLA